MKKATDKILKEEFINENINSFCVKCKTHFNKWTHLITGFEGTHIATNEEITNMTNEMNENDLLEIITAEKGTNAKTILTKFDITKPPKEIPVTSLAEFKISFLNLFKVIISFISYEVIALDLLILIFDFIFNAD